MECVCVCGVCEEWVGVWSVCGCVQVSINRYIAPVHGSLVVKSRLISYERATALERSRLITQDYQNIPLHNMCNANTRTINSQSSK